LFEKLELTLYEVYQQQITAIDFEIEKCLANFEPKTLNELPATKKNAEKSLPPITQILICVPLCTGWLV